jgi:hypothetical protein
VDEGFDDGDALGAGAADDQDGWGVRRGHLWRNCGLHDD